MSILKIKSQNLDLELVLDGNGSTIQTSGMETFSTGSPETRLHAALIALALSNCVSCNGEHDTESGIITIQYKATEWTSKAFSFTNTKF